MVLFPSLEWFEALRRLVNADPGFRHFGTIDTTVGVRAGEQAFSLVFEDFECNSVREVSPPALDDCDFYLDQTLPQWKEMLENIREHGKADIDHTLNTLDLKRADGLARSNDGYKLDLFYRFNQSLQDFFDTSSRIETVFSDSALE